MPPRNNCRFAPAGQRKGAPLCDRLPLLSVLELARCDAQRRKLGSSTEASADSDEQRRLEMTQRHLEQDRCPICLRWYRNALAAAGVPHEEEAP